MVAFTPPNSPPPAKLSGKIAGGSVFLILGIIVFFASVFVPILIGSIFWMIPLFLGGFILMTIGAIFLTTSMRNRSMTAGTIPGQRMMERNMKRSMKIFGINSKQQPPTARYDSAYEKPISSNADGPISDYSTQSANEHICTYCGASNTSDRSFCIGCGAKLER